MWSDIDAFTNTKRQEDRDELTVLDLFQLPSIDSLSFCSKFPKLKELILNQLPNVHSLQGIASCSDLQILCISDITLSNGIDYTFRNCPNLVHIAINRSGISDISPLSTLTQLEKLFLMRNNIQDIRPLEKLVNLKHVSLAQNKIKQLDALETLNQLEHLNVAGNQINSFLEITRLTKLASLRKLYLTDPHFVGNPVCKLSNYQVFTIYHLPQLTHLDTIPIPEHTRVFAKSKYLEKKLFYDMRIKALKRNANLIVTHIQTVQRIAMARVNMYRHILRAHQVEDLDIKNKVLEMLQEVKNIGTNGIQRVRDDEQTTVVWIRKELESGGNVRPPSKSSNEDDADIDDALSAFCATLKPRELEDVGNMLPHVLQTTKKLVVFHAGKERDQQLHALFLPMAPRTSDTSNLACLNLHGQKLETCPNLSKCDNLERLILSFNQLRSLPSMSHLKRLQYVDISFNLLTEFPQGFEGCSELEIVLASNNMLRDLSQVLARLPPANLQELSLYGNPLCEQVHYERSICSALPVLQILDDASVADSSSAEAMDERLVSATITSMVYNDRKLQNLSGIDRCHMLEELSLEGNALTDVSALGQLTHLRRLELGRNALCHLDGLPPTLEYLSVSDNHIDSLDGIESIQNLVELYLSSNRLHGIHELAPLKLLHGLAILDLQNNPIASIPSYRLQLIFHTPQLFYLDYVMVTEEEINKAKDYFHGRVGIHQIELILGQTQFSELVDLNLSACKIRRLESGVISHSHFCSLKKLNLSHNRLQSMSGITHLPNLQVLNLSHNRLQRIDDHVHAPNITILELGHNRITSLMHIRLTDLPVLEFLMLENNSITSLQGIRSCTSLRQLVLDQNRISLLSPEELCALVNLRALRLDANGLRLLCNMDVMPKLRTLSLGKNRISDLNELSKIFTNADLLELNLQFNSVQKKIGYGALVLHHLQSLRVLDGKPIAPEDREQVVPMEMSPSLGPTLSTSIPTAPPIAEERPRRVSTLTVSRTLQQAPTIARSKSAQIDISEPAPAPKRYFSGQVNSTLPFISSAISVSSESSGAIPTHTVSYRSTESKRLLIHSAMRSANRTPTPPD